MAYEIESETLVLGATTDQSVLQPPNPWPHAPTHIFPQTGTYMVTSATYRKEPFFHDHAKLNMLHNALHTIAKSHNWQLEAWAVFPNHYHIIACTSDDPKTLSYFLQELHSRTAIALNRHNGTPGRQIWHNYWDTHITHEKSYLARLHYVHQNAVKHGVATNANQYPWCSAKWFEQTATPAKVKTVYSFKTDRVNVHDDY